MGEPCLEVKEQLFWGERIDNILVLSFRESKFSQLIDLGFKEALMKYLDCLACCDDIKVLMIKASPVEFGRKEYVEFYKNLISPSSGNISLERIYNGINQIILKLINLNKVVINVDSGKLYFARMNMGLVCDYRIISDDTVFHNPNIDLDVTPKGAGPFFLSRMLGKATALKILLGKEDITADKALELGIVDEVVPLAKLHEAAMAAARRFADFPARYFVGIKRLLNYDARDLGQYLEYENELIRRQVDCCSLSQLGRCQ
jgi:2-(1,2-epoxy-1,2-dihydrophenyl)acetyl-CoA isomerase